MAKGLADAPSGPVNNDIRLVIIQMSFQAVPLSQIVMGQPYFAVDFPPHKAIGCIPPWLVQVGEMYHILDGFAEVEQAKIQNPHNDSQTIGAKIFSIESDPIVLWEQVIERRLSLEQISAALFLELLQDLVAKTEISFDDPRVTVQARKFALKQKWLTKKQVEIFCKIKGYWNDLQILCNWEEKKSKPFPC